MRSRIRNWGIRLSDALRNARIRFGNWLRKRVRRKIGYIVIDLSGTLPEYSAPRPRWQRFLPALGFRVSSRPLSLSDIRQALERIAGDPRPKGILVNLSGISVGWSRAQSLRGLLADFKKSGKKVAAYCGDDFHPLNYFVACAADQIYAPPGASWAVMGLRTESVFLKEALAAWGVQAQVVAVSPYKTAGDMFGQADITPEHREMLNWLLDGYFDTLVAALAESRHLEPERVKDLIDQAPFMVAEAAEAGLLDGTLYLDELSRLLGGKPARKGRPNPAGLVNLDEVYRSLCRPVRKRSGKTVGVIALQGAIIPGESQNIPLPIPLPIVGNQQAGSDTIAQRFRQVERDDRIAGVVLYVDSPGGSSLASDLIWREVERVRQNKPVVVYMGETAASGGYYVSANADWIVSQPLTVTGSIGVIFLKLLTTGFFDRFHANRVNLQRGAHAGIYADNVPLEGELRQLVEKGILDVYDQFKQRVSTGRKLDEQALEQIAGGRVWLGFQAQEHGLVDELGDMKRAVDKVCELAELPPDRWTPAVLVSEGKGNRLPLPFQSESPNQEWIPRLLALLRERAWMLAPFKMHVQ